MIILRNDFHNTTVNIRPINGRISRETWRRALRRLCPRKGCKCPNPSRAYTAKEYEWLPVSLPAVGGVLDGNVFLTIEWSWDGKGEILGYSLDWR